MKSLFKKALNSKYKYLYVIIALIITIIILRFFLDLIVSLPTLIIWGVILFIPILFIVGFVMSLLDK